MTPTTPAPTPDSYSSTPTPRLLYQHYSNMVHTIDILNSKNKLLKY